MTTETTETTNKFFVSYVYTLRDGNVLRRKPFGPLDAAPTESQMEGGHLHTAAAALAGDDQLVWTSEPDWTPTETDTVGQEAYVWDGDGKWLLTKGAGRGKWNLLGPGGAEVPIDATDPEEAMESADAHITDLREDPMAPEHWRQDSVPRDHAGVLTFIADTAGPVAVPVESISYMRVEITDSAGNVVVPKPGWPAPCNHVPA